MPVVVAGGGITGLSAALAVAQAGREVAVYERDATPSEEGAGIQLSPNATRHLAVWGVLDRLAVTALAPETAIVRRGRDGTELARLDLREADRRWGAPFRIAHRADLHRALIEAVAAQPGITIRSGTPVTGWSDEADLRIHTGAGDIAATALIVADGVRSLLRETFEPGAPLVHSGRTAWRALVPADRCLAFARALATNLWLGASAHLVHYPLRGGSVVNLVAVVSDHETRGEHAGANDVDALSRAFDGWCPDVRSLIACSSDWRAWPLFSRAVPSTLARDRVALAGDAAHPMMPFLAQGGSQAIEDAAALGASFAKHQDASKALASYSSARLSRVKTVVAASERQAKIYHLGGAAAVARDTAMRLAGETGLRLATDWLYRA